MSDVAWVMLSCVVPQADGVGIEKRAWAHLTAMAALRAPRLVLALTPAQQARMPDLAPLSALCESVQVLPLVQTLRGRRLSNTTAFLCQRLLCWGRPAWRLAAGALDEMRRTVQRDSPHAHVFCFRLACFELWQQLASRHGANGGRLVVDFDDIESVAQRRALRVEGRALGRAHALAGWLEAAESSRLETAALRSAEVLVCSTVDRERLLRRLPGSRVGVVPNAYPVLPALPPREAGPVLNLLFLGTLSYAPNIDAVDHLVRTLLPAVRRAWAGPVHLQIVGRRPTAAVLAAHQPPDIQVLADVPDITAAYAQADVVVVPIRFGGGTRIKILEALSLGRPVVTTSLGVEGLDFRDGQDLLIADAPAEFAQACVRIARDPTFAAALAAQGRRSFLDLYSHEVVRDQLVAMLSRPPSAAREP